MERNITLTRLRPDETFKLQKDLLKPKQGRAERQEREQGKLEGREKEKT